MVLVSNGNGEGLNEIKEETSSATSIGNRVNGHTDHQWISTTIPSRVRMLESNSIGSLASPSATLSQIEEGRDEISRSVPSSTSHGFRQRFNGIIAKKIDWASSLRKMFKEWIRDPYNKALFIWISCVFISGVILLLVMTGILNGVLAKKSERDVLKEVNNQILNALFTLLCLYLHPKRFYHLVLLFHWKPKDIPTLRKEYCKNGTYKPNERTHMMVVVVLLNVNCFAQYAICGLTLGFKKSARPATALGISTFFAIVAPTIAGIYSSVSPLGKKYESDELDEESQNPVHTADTSLRSHPEKRYSFATRIEQAIIVENQPKWKGGLFDMWDDIPLAYLSLCCTCCIFGWNMERLGFGNMFVQIATFLLFCMAPFFIFNLAAINIDNDSVKEAFAITGVILLVFGLLYGGLWRIQMRKRFNLPANNACCGKPNVADCTQWLFCCWCSLAQEVRTANFYYIVEDKSGGSQTDENGQPVLSPLPREDGATRFQPCPSSPPWNSSTSSELRAENTPNPSRHLKDNSSPDNSMIPPPISFIQREDNADHKI